MKFSFLWMFLFLFFPFWLWAQERTVENGNQQWVQYYNQTKLSPGWALLVDGGYRWRDGFTQRSQYIARIGAGFQVTDELRLALGFAHLGFYQDEVIIRIEFRPYQELLLKQILERIELGHRFRVEERYFQEMENRKRAGEGHFNYRFRYRFSVNIPLFRLSDREAERRLLLGLADEIFLNAGASVIHDFFDQNRLMVGPVLQFNGKLSIRLTGNFQFSSTRTPTTFKRASILWLGINHKLDLTK